LASDYTDLVHITASGTPALSAINEGIDFNNGNYI